MPDDPGSLESPGQSRPAEDDLLTLTTTAAHELALLRGSMTDQAQPPGSLSAEVASARDTLRRAVVAYVQSLRGAGATPVQAILRVKGAVVPELTLAPHDRRACVDDIVRWTIKAYYDA
jgi:hypothetical protein